MILLVFNEIPIGSTQGKERTKLLIIYHVFSIVFTLTCLALTTTLPNITYLQFINERTLAQSLIKPI